MTRICRARVLGQKGAAAIEAVVYGTLVLLWIISMVEAGRMALIYYSLSEGTKQAAQRAMVGSSAGTAPVTVEQLRTLVQTRVLGAGSLRPTTTVTYTSANAPGNTVLIQSEISYAPGYNLIGLPAITLRARSERPIVN
jgi:Flp pilus assembly protein TadG